MLRGRSGEKSDSKNRLGNAAQQILTNSTNLRENSSSEGYRRQPDLQLRIEELIYDNQQKDITIAALQRNYEGISRVFKEEKGKSGEWSEKIGNLEKENNALKARIQTFESQKQKIGLELEKTQEELAKVLKFYEESKGFKAENSGLKQLLEKRKKEFDETNYKFEILKNENEVLRKTKAEIEANFKKIKAEFDIVNRDKEILADDSRVLKEQVERLSAETFEKENLLQKFRYEIANSNEKDIANSQIIGNLRKELNDEKVELTSTRNKMRELYQHFQELKKQHDSKETLLKATFNSEIDLNAKMTSLQETLAERDLEVEKLKNENENLSSSLAESNIKINNTEKDLDITKSLLNEKISNFDRKEKELKNEIKNLAESLEEFKNKSLALEKELNLTSNDKEISERNLSSDAKRAEQLLKDELISKSQEINKLTKESSNFKQIIEGLSKENSLLSSSKKTLEASISKLQEDLNLFDIQRSQYQNLLSNQSQYTKDIESQLIEKSKQAVELDEKRKLAVSLQEELDTIMEINRKLNTENSQFKIEIDLTQKEIQKQNARVDSLCNEVEVLQQEIKNYKKQISGLEISNFNLQELVSKAEKSLAINDKSMSQIQILQSQLLSATSEKDSINKAKSILETELLQRVSEISRLKKQISEEQNNSKSTGESNIALLQRIEQLRSELEKYRPSELDTQRAIKSLQERERQLGKGLERMEHALHSMETNLSCHSCFNLLEDALMCLPCGHVSCGKCKPTDEEDCPQCQGIINRTIAVPSFSEIAGKLIYEKQALEDMKNLLSVS